MEEKYAEQDQGGTVGVAVGDTLGAGLLMTADAIEGQYGQVETIRGGRMAKPSIFNLHNSIR